jgi:uncharacterized membrane protein YsdA (DUF1294 family)
MDMIYIYIVVINALALVLMLMDKYKAKKNLWRIPEATLLGIAAIGGSLGAIIGMRLFHHKTKHLTFSVGLPILLAIHILLGMIVYTKTA